MRIIVFNKNNTCIFIKTIHLLVLVVAGCSRRVPCEKVGLDESQLVLLLFERAVAEHAPPKPRLKGTDSTKEDGECLPVDSPVHLSEFVDHLHQSWLKVVVMAFPLAVM